MRLTLRNLLAYLDGILEPQDAQDLAKKVEESKFASDLIHRIRDLMRRLRLAAPSVSERGPGLAPNTVAEYLDNTLPADRVTDFEKVCLEANTTMADIHLAEVAACHQILTLVLGDPAEISPALREKIYQLPAQAKAQEEASQAQATVHVPPPIPAHLPEQTAVPQDLSLDYKSRPKPTVPEYLRDSRKKYSWFAATAGILAAVCLLLIVLVFRAQFENLLVSMGVMSPKQEVVSVEKGSKEGGNTALKNGDQASNVEEPKPEAGKTSPENANQQVPPDKPTTDGLKTPGTENPITPPGGEPPMNAPPQNAQETTPPAGENHPGTTVSTVPPAGEPTMPGGEAVVQKPAASEQPLPGNHQVAINNPPATVNPNETTPTAQKPIGRFTSSDQILLRSNGDLGNWERLPTNTMLFPQQHLLTLPTYRTAVMLSSGLILQMLGGTELELLPGDEQLPAGIKIRYGRMVINSPAKAGIRLRLVIGDQSYVLTFLDPDTNAGIVVRRIHSLGVAPETEAAQIMTEVFVTKDRAGWEDGIAKPSEIASPARILLMPQIPAVTDHPKDFPPWIAAAEPLNINDRRASQFMLQAFNPETSAQQKLLELADPTQTRQIELRRLAVRSLGYLGDFDSMVKVLNDAENKFVWPDYYDWLREAVTRDAQTAAAVRDALEKRYSTQAPVLYRMLWGYSDKDLIAGEDRKLVKNLDDESLPVRVLAIRTLVDITGKDQGYKAEDPPAKRAPKVRYWEKRQEEKEIRYKSPEKKGPAAVPSPPAPAPATDDKP